MRRFMLYIDLENEAFRDGSAGPEVERILRDVADRLGRGHPLMMGALRDANGNTCGEAVVTMASAVRPWKRTGPELVEED